MKNLFVQKSFDVSGFKFLFLKHFLGQPTFLSSSGQSEIRVHQCSFNKTFILKYIFENILYTQVFIYISRNQKISFTKPDTSVGLDKHSTIPWHPHFVQTTVVETSATPPTTRVQHQTHYAASIQVRPQGRPQYYIQYITINSSETLLYQSLYIYISKYTYIYIVTLPGLASSFLLLNYHL